MGPFSDTQHTHLGIFILELPPPPWYVPPIFLNFLNYIHALYVLLGKWILATSFSDVYQIISVITVKIISVIKVHLPLLVGGWGVIPE